MTDFPRLALSVRQPWAWAIIHAGKDVENRSAAALKHMTGLIPCRVAVHASKGLTQPEYIEAVAGMAGIGVATPAAADLARGGIIGTVDLVRIERTSASRWFSGPRCIVLARPEPCDFVPCSGDLGLFRWRRGDPASAPQPALWMVKQKEAGRDLFGNL